MGHRGSHEKINLKPCKLSQRLQCAIISMPGRSNNNFQPLNGGEFLASGREHRSFYAGTNPIHFQWSCRPQNSCLKGIDWSVAFLHSRKLSSLLWSFGLKGNILVRVDTLSSGIARNSQTCRLQCQVQIFTRAGQWIAYKSWLVDHRSFGQGRPATIFRDCDTDIRSWE